MSSLFNFIFNTLSTRVNDPNNRRFWLPVVLEGIDGSNARGKLLPLGIREWNVGGIGGDAGTTLTGSFATNYMSYLEKVKKVSFAGQEVIASPASPLPLLSFANVTINGLQNLRVLDHPPVLSGTAGYETTVTLQTNYYDGSGELPSLPLFGLSGTYMLSQCMCTADIVDGATTAVCNGNYSMDIQGSGQVSINITDAFIQASLRISLAGEGNKRTPVVTVMKLWFPDALSGTQPGFSIESLSIDAGVSSTMIGIWKQLAEEALTSPDGQKGIFDQVNASLNESSNLQKLGETMTSQLCSALDKMIGAVPEGRLPDDSGQQLPNPADLYLFDRLRFALNDPSGQFYLPRTVCSISDPALEPLQFDNLSLPDQDINGTHYTQIRLVHCVITGLSNLSTDSRRLVFDASGSLDATVDVGGLDPPPGETFDGRRVPPPPLTARGAFTLLPDGMDEPLTGNFTLTVLRGTLHFHSTFEGEALSDLSLTLQDAQIRAAPEQIHITPKVDSVFQDFIGQILNSPGILRSALDKINEMLGSHLDSISREISKVTARGVASRLDS